ncbi:uncharacterized protein N7473_005227 [Penicillium subrubescens]|uniref:Uncharacterized protein n=1 Tax=Penicillium subrubescens TaxID=1316194 RepID=A0A1Q5UMF9_9EURO|nr:uncharacterized protein N7473_005227 [Penicillium subrubescens]KAJ5895828.1 hypothetical protein N7473_005227 [Penicillium subrubescens]OKP13639.1 hypothetical protein PENSUB_830 [Penicillium subrubescens]
MAQRKRAGYGGIVKYERQPKESSMQETAVVRDQSVSFPVRPLGRELAAKGPGGSEKGTGCSSQAELPDALFQLRGCRAGARL